MIESQKYIIVKGAKENNLKNVNVRIPKNQLVVFTGVSGSGKSSLAFNTIYEEGRRRYVDSLSSYARQFLGGTNKPLVDSIEGLSPAISIEQKTTHNNPRSTVGTVTEIYDYLRLLYARVGKPYSPYTGKEITAQKPKDILDRILKYPENTKLIILAPIVKSEKGTHAKVFEKLKKDGFLRVKVDNEIRTLDENIVLSKNTRHSIDIVIDRIVLNEDVKARISEAIELALEYGKGFLKVTFDDKITESFSKFYSCPEGNFDMPLIEPRLFSFNAPAGMCESCNGLGIKLKVDPKKLIPDANKSIAEGGIVYFKNTVETDNLEWQQFEVLLKHYDIKTHIPLNELSDFEMNTILYGSKDIITYELFSNSGNRFSKTEYIEGIATKIERKHLGSTSERVRTWYRNTFMSDMVCEVCKGKRLNKYALAVKIGGLDISEFTQMSIGDSLNFIMNLELSKQDTEIATIILNEIVSRLTFLNNVGLDYLTLDRKAETLSGGESQRIKLATQIGSNLTGVLYVLDEPSIGLHQRDNQKLIATLKHMVDIGNTLIVVEHDDETIREADYIVDIGPKAGDLGGEIVATGSPEEVSQNLDSLTADFLSGRKKIDIPNTRRIGNGKFILIKGAAENNLKNIDVEIPLNKFVAITGVSGSGKSTLINEVLTKSLEQRFSNPFVTPGLHKSISGIQNLDKVIRISQSPIGRTPRSNPATYTGVFDDIRSVFAQVPLARQRGYDRSRFSFNVPGGRCEKCHGDGVIKIEMHFLPDVYVVCDHCNGKRYNDETLEVKFKGKSIADVLEMRVSEAVEFFQNDPKIRDKLQTLVDVGLGYITLGQNATTLSGGEAQRVKLATYLLKKPTGKTLYVLDEPTTGLHQYDVQKLISVLNRIVDGGDTVLVIEHNLDMIKVADHLIDLGPNGGINGGQIVAQGSPEEVALVQGSYTGQFLKEILNEQNHS